MATSCYNPRYLTASFRGVSFTAVEAGSEHGRRGAEGEFPFGEETAYADLGRRIRRFNVTGEFRENSHVSDASSLIRACERSGAGTLVHPTRGVVTVACTSLKVTDRVEQGQGVTQVDMQFVEANEVSSGIKLGFSLGGISIGPLSISIRGAFTAAFNISGIQPFRRLAVVFSARRLVRSIRIKFESATGGSLTAANRSRIVRDLNTVSESHDLASDASTMDRSLALGMNAVAANLSGNDKFNVFRDLANEAAQSSTFSSPAREAEEAVFALVRVLSAAYMAEGALEAEGNRTAEIFSQYDAIESVLESEMQYAKSAGLNDLFLELSSFRVDALAQLSTKAYNSPGLVEYQFAGRVSPLAAAYAITGDAKDHRSLEVINTISHDGRVGSRVIAERGGE